MSIITMTCIRSTITLRQNHGSRTSPLSRISIQSGRICLTPVRRNSLKVAATSQKGSGGLPRTAVCTQIRRKHSALYAREPSPALLSFILSSRYLCDHSRTRFGRFCVKMTVKQQKRARISIFRARFCCWRLPVTAGNDVLGLNRQ